MILGLGNDLIRVSRIQRLLERYGERLHDKLLMPEECEALATARHPANRIAKAFAAKEAFVKAWGTGFRGIGHRDCGVRRGALGQPQLLFSPALEAALEARGVGRCHLALTDQDDWVLATVVIEGR